ncbi:MAG: FUSC family protein [Alphaproteobacteria bacterium]
MVATARPGPTVGVEFLSFLREELEPRPGRLAAVARMAGSCALVVTIGMIYEIPLVPYMAYLVFLLSREDAAGTLLTAVVGLLAVTLAIALSLLLYTFDAAEPALRLPLMAANAFFGMWLSRILTLGPMAFLASFVLVMSQTLVDRVPNMEILTRAVLWLWVVVAVPVAVTVLVHLVWGENPARLARERGERLLRDLAEALRTGRHAAEPGVDEAVELAELRKRANLLDPNLKGRDAVDLRLIESLAELSLLQRLLPASLPAAASRPLAEAMEDCADALHSDRTPAAAPVLPEAGVLDGLSATARPVLVAMVETIGGLREGLARRLESSLPSAPPAEQSPFAADAFTNPDHVRFALKTAAAVMAAYVIYSAVAWPEISTAVTTCFFVALGSFAETMHKLTLRLSGAMIGGLLGAFCIVYVLPAMTGIGELALLIALSSALFGWVSTSSERLSYAGMQMAFAFFLGVMQGYGPSTELSVLRDRVVGILLGNLLIALAFTVLWPTSAATRARVALGDALAALGRMLRETGGATADQRLGVLRGLAEAHRLTELSGFEFRLIPGKDVNAALLSSLERLAGAVVAVVNQPSGSADRARDADLAAEIDGLAGVLAPQAAPVPTTAAATPAATARNSSDSSLVSAREARDLLQAELDHVAALCS